MWAKDGDGFHNSNSCPSKSFLRKERERKRKERERDRQTKRESPPPQPSCSLAFSNRKTNNYLKEYFLIYIKIFTISAVMINCKMNDRRSKLDFEIMFESFNWD